MSAPPRVALAPGYTVSRVIKGGWQLAGGHGSIDRAAALADMHAFVDAGVTTFDCADIYTGVEQLIGDFVRARGRADDLQIHTKYVPDRSRLAQVTRADVTAAIDRALGRLGVEAIDLVQLHWWDYAVQGLVEVAGWLTDERAAGRIRHLGATNFDTPTLTRLLDAGVPIVSHQVQYSVLDRRPAGAMQALCAARGVQLVGYGTLAGGFLSERYLGAPPPRPPLENRSLVKYRLIIDEAGGWARFQAMLAVLAAVAEKHAVEAATVATAWVLDQPTVAAAIVGARHGRHLAATLAAAATALDPADRQAIAAAVAAGPAVAGDVYALERTPGSPHAAIMRYDLNAVTGDQPPGSGEAAG